MAAYLDRPTERLRDLEDIAHLLESYVDDSSPRFWDDALAWGEDDQAPAYLLGLDIGRIWRLAVASLSQGGDVVDVDSKFDHVRRRKRQAQGDNCKAVTCEPG